MSVPFVLVHMLTVSLQHEIFDGLARRRLGGLQLYIEEASNDGISPLKLETYTMSFEYGGKRGTANDLDGTVDTVLKPRSLRDIRKYINDMTRKLSMLKDAPAPPSTMGSILLCSIDD